MNRLNSELREKAVELGLCAKWQREWSEDCDPQQLIDKYKKGIDFCIANQFPSNEYITANFDRGLLNDNLIFVDEYFPYGESSLPSGVYILNGHCSGVLNFSGFAAATVFVRHDSEIMIVADDMAKVIVRLYDDAVADVIQLGDSGISVLHH